MPTFLQNIIAWLNGTQVGGVNVGWMALIAGALLLFKDKLPASVQAIIDKLLALIGMGPKTAAATDLDQIDTLDMAAFHRLEERFRRNECKEGQDAMKIVATHFMHGKE